MRAAPPFHLTSAPRVKPIRMSVLHLYCLAVSPNQIDAGCRSYCTSWECVHWLYFCLFLFLYCCTTIRDTTGWIASIRRCTLHAEAQETKHAYRYGICCLPFLRKSQERTGEPNVTLSVYSCFGCDPFPPHNCRYTLFTLVWCQREQIPFYGRRWV